MRIDAGNNPPLPGIESPTTSTRFRLRRRTPRRREAG
jgi:hypothetical protein